VGRGTISRRRGPERKDFAKYLAQVRHMQLATREIAHHNNQHTRTEYTDKYNKANKVVYPRYVAGDKVWVKVMDKNQQSPNPKLAPPWERGTIVQRGVTETSYKVERHDRKRKKVKTVNVQQIKPFIRGGEGRRGRNSNRAASDASAPNQSADAVRRVRLRRRGR
jgi:hypothetical protein